MTYPYPPKRSVTLPSILQTGGEGEGFVPSLPSNLAKITGTDTSEIPEIINSLLGAGGSAEMALVPEQRTAHLIGHRIYRLRDWRAQYCGPQHMECHPLLY